MFKKILEYFKWLNNRDVKIMLTLFGSTIDEEAIIKHDYPNNERNIKYYTKEGKYLDGKN